MSRIDVTQQKLSTVSQTYLGFAKVVSGIICNVSSIHPKFSSVPCTGALTGMLRCFGRSFLPGEKTPREDPLM